MNILSDVYLKYLSENEKNLRFWEEYVNNLKSLDFSLFEEKLTVPTLVPIGSRIFFKGELKHTNEVNVALGADYFVKCSVKQAEVLRQHRMKGAQEKVDMFLKEKEYIERQMCHSKEYVFENDGQDIIEVYSEEEDRAWREKHRDNVRQYKKKEKTIEEASEVTDDELWDRLEELELQEELQNELNMDYTIETKQSHKPDNSLIINEPEEIITQKEKLIIQDKGAEEENPDMKKIDSNKNAEKVSKLDIFRQVIDKQNELEQKLIELKSKERGQAQSEQELMSRLDEMEQLEELEDEMDRLEDILNTEDVDNSDDCRSSDEEDTISKSSSTTVRRGVTFADEDDSETLELVFKHSIVEPSDEPYDPEKGIKKPSDVYKAYSNLFNETTPILKKKNYVNNESIKSKVTINEKIPVSEKELEPEDNVCTRTIVVKDVIERVDQHGNKLENSDVRPTSLFKKKRLQKKS